LQLKKKDKKIQKQSQGKQTTTKTNTNKNKNTIHTSAKILLVGQGADDLMAGYSRHRSVYAAGGYPALQAELNLEKGRLWTRNLGRDDRCIAACGREGRTPFLDEDVVNYLASLRVESIVDFDRPQGEGDKMILRKCGELLGLGSVCTGLVKRAIQFGSRISQESNKVQFGSNSQGKGDVQWGNLY